MEAETFALTKLPPVQGVNESLQSPETKRRTEQQTNYTLKKKSNNRYYLPSANSLKPYMDTHCGELDTWPAHASGRITSPLNLTINSDRRLVVVDDEKLGRPQIVPKPKFLDQLEAHLKKELKSVHSPVAETSADLRLQAYREVFDALIEGFKTYRPLLSSIKNEYEMALLRQREAIRQLEPLRQMLVTVSDQCEQKIMSLREEENQEITSLSRANKQLQKKIEEMTFDRVTLEVQVERLQDDLAEQYHKYRDECDARKLLIADINDLRYQQEAAAVLVTANQSSGEVDDSPMEEEGDVTMLKIAVRRAREDEAVVSRRLNEMIANYGDVIPRRDFEAMEKNYQQLEESMQLLRNDNQKLHSDHQVLLDVHKQALEQRDEYYAESKMLRRSATPRPQWERCADIVAGGQVRWKILSEGKTSDQLVDVLLGEIAGGSSEGDHEGGEDFEGLGLDRDVPVYLRFEGKLHNKRLGKRDCAILVRDVWKEKAIYTAENDDPQGQSLTDYLLVYLKNRFGLEQLVFEWAYNLHDACQRYSHDDRIGEFYRILTGEVDEGVYHHHLQLITNLYNILTRIDSERGSTGLMTKDEFRICLEEFFPYHSGESILSLIHAAEVDLNAKDLIKLPYTKLFMTDDEGKTGPFLDELKKQAKQERQQYVEEIKANLDSNNRVTVDDLRRAILTSDPEIDLSQLDKYLIWAFRVNRLEELNKAKSQSLDTILQRLNCGNINRIGRKPDS